MTIRANAAEFTLRVHLPTGDQRFDLSKLNKNQIEGVREMVVNHWCRERGLSPLYKEAGQ